MIRVANAPVSYGAFELTVGVLPNVPGPEQVLDAIAAAGYEGTELGPPGYLGDRQTLLGRLKEHNLELAAAFVPLRFGDPDEDFASLDQTLALLDGTQAKPVLADAGPRREVSWQLFWAAVEHAVERAAAAGFAPTFHPHMDTAVQTPLEIEELLEETSVGLLLDTGHLTAAGGDAVDGLRDWLERIDHVHVKDVRLDMLGSAESWDRVWRDGVFCELGAGNVDLEGVFAELTATAYSGWIVVEQDRVPGPDDALEAQIEAQARNRRWLKAHAGV